MPDEMLTRLASNGGVCMVTFVPGFVSQLIADVWLELLPIERAWNTELPDAPDEVARRVHAWMADHPYPAATLAQVADHIEHVRDVAGIEQVGIGGDYDGCPEMPIGLEDVAGYPRLFAELRRRRWSDVDLRALAGGNVLRVLRSAEDVAGAAREMT